jgi:hypothetical protein
MQTNMANVIVKLIHVLSLAFASNKIVATNNACGIVPHEELGHSTTPIEKDNVNIMKFSHV